MGTKVQSKSETEIARELHCNVSTIYRDIKYLKKLSQQFVFDLAKDLGFYYKGCIDTMDQIQQKCCYTLQIGNQTLQLDYY
jgi:hypothetical protein